MNRNLFIYEALERLRRETRRNGEPVALELHAPRPYWPEPVDAADRREDDEVDRGVVVFDMSDYSEWKV